jgi:hypothetical protein
MPGFAKVSDAKSPFTDFDNAFHAEGDAGNRRNDESERQL